MKFWRGAFFRRGVPLLLFCLPTLVYWPTIFHRYGFRDDYPSARESREDQNKLIGFVATQARPVYAELLINSFKHVRRVEDFQWIRLGSALLWGVLAASLYAVLRSSGWDGPSSGLMAAVLPLLPSGQVVVSWAVAWPHVFALLLVLGGFVAKEHGAKSARRFERLVWGSTAVALIMVSALIYQPSTFFYIALVAAGWLPRARGWSGDTRRWLLSHATVFLMGAALAFVSMMGVYKLGWLDVSRRVAFEHHLGAKLAWFIREPLSDAFALIVLNDSVKTPIWHHVAVALTSLVLAGGAWVRFRRGGWVDGAVWMAALAAFSVTAYGVNLLVSERLGAYRTLLPVVAVVLFFGVDALTRATGRHIARVGLAAIALVGAVLARSQTLELFARTQEAELAVVEHAAAQIPPGATVRIFAVCAKFEDTPGLRRFADEFGTLTADGGWAVYEMLVLSLLERCREHMPRIQLTEGWELPATARTDYDLVIDLRTRQNLALRRSDAGGDVAGLPLLPSEPPADGAED